MFNFNFLTSAPQFVLTPDGKGPEKSNLMEIATNMNLAPAVSSEPTAVMVDQVIEQVLLFGTIPALIHILATFKYM